MKEIDYFDYADKIENEFSIDFKKIFFMLWNRKKIMIETFITVLCFFILLTFIIPKKYKVEADLYINKTNNSNMAELNPYFIDEVGGVSINSISDKVMLNEVELMQSALVIDKVIVENDLRVPKFLGIIPTKKTGKYLTPEKFLKKGIKFENKKGTSVVTITYKSKDRELAYNVVNSIITNYMALHKELNSEKSKSDKKIIEAEYNRAKSNLNKRMQSVSGLPTNSLTGTGNLAAMSAFSKSAQNAIAQLQGQYVAGEKSQLSVKEDADKVAYLSSKLEWANLVEEMSDSSKVLVIREPRLLEDYEQSSPKLFTNILLGIVFGAIFSLMALIYSEKTDKKLSYSMLGDNIIYDLDKEINTLSAEVISDSDRKTAFIFFEEMSKQTYEKFKDYINIVPIKAEISNSFKESLKGVNSVVTFASIGKTSSEQYKLVKKMITNLDKNILYEVLI